MNRPRPNVLILISDQHNPHIAGFEGDKRARTQHLDRLAAESVRFTSAYCQCPLCTPSRISLWTGMLPWRCAAWGNNMPIFPEFCTLPEHFGRHGYATCGIGKMHVGGERPMNGFHERPYGDLIPNCFCGHQPDPIHSAKDQNWTNHQVGRFTYAGATEVPESLIQDHVVSCQAAAWIRDHAATSKDKPWFVCASYQRPHHPLTAPSRYFKRYWPQGSPPLGKLPDGYPDNIHPHDRFIVEDFNLAKLPREEIQRGLAAYYASVDYLDDCIGDLLNSLESEGLLKNTVVVYLSDHGDLASEYGLWWKRSPREGSARVPLLIRVPDNPTIGQVDTPVELVDIFPTLCDVCQIPKPRDLDGETLLPFLHGSGERRRKDFARSEYLLRSESCFRMIRTPRWKYVEFLIEDWQPMLFDMQEDPQELSNIAAEPTHQGLIAELHERLWSDGQNWESLLNEKRLDLERAQKEKYTHYDCSPNQFALPDGTLINAEMEFYRQFLRDMA